MSEADAAPYRTLDEASRAQADAAHPGASVWVSANAGSGKTRVLTTRVARLLLAGADPSRILCLTYTKAAAAEMRNRLFKILGGWAMAEDAVLAEALDGVLTEDEPPLDAGQHGAARRLFAQALETPGGLKIQTIHAFCEGLLSRFPLEAGVSPHFEVIDDALQRTLLAEALDAAALARAEDAPLADAFGALIATLNEESLAQLLAQAAAMRAEYDGAAEAELAAFLGVAPGASPADALADWARALSQDAIADMAAFLSGSEKPTSQKSGAAAGALAEALRGGALESAADAARTLLMTKQGPAKKLSSIVTKDALTSAPWLEALLTRMQEAQQQLEHALAAAERFAASRALLVTARRVLAHYAEAKAARAALDYDDLIERAAALLTRAEARDWVRFKLDGGIEHILVDEAQDTSPAQWRVVAALAEEFFAGDGAREARAAPDEDGRLTPPTPRTIFAVGDEKQSIYSFQGAAPALLSEMGARFAEAAGAAGRAFAASGLETSFRSSPAILSFVDGVFQPPDAAQGLTFGSGGVRHRAHRDAPGLVEVWPLIQPRDAAETPDWDAPLDAAPPDDPVARLAALVAETASGWIGREPLRGRTVRPGDILVLVRGRGRLSNGVIKRLKQLGVPVAGRDRLKLADELAAKDLLALARFLLFPEDDLSLAEVLRSPLCDIDEDALFALAHGRASGKALWYALGERRSEAPAFAEAHGRLQDLVARADYQRPFELFSAALGPLGGRARLVGRLGAEAEDPIDELLAQCLAYERVGAPTLQGFLSWLAARETEIKRELEQGRDEVRVMTAHGAKGLEAPLVILPDTLGAPSGGRPLSLLAPRRFDPARRGVPPIRLGRAGQEPPAVAFLRDAHANAEAEEHRRLLYVALTRAEDRLLIAGATRLKKPPAGSWYALCRAALEPGGALSASASARPAPEPFGADAGPILAYGAALEAAAAISADKITAAPSPAPAQASSSAQAAPSAPPAWLQARAPAETQPRDVAPSHLGGEDPEAAAALGKARSAFAPEVARRRGVLIHRLLEILPTAPPTERTQLADAILAAEGPDLPASACAGMAAEALSVLEDPALAPYFGPDTLAEVPLTAVLPDLGPGEVSGYIDRLAVGPEEVLAIDYKTGPEPPAPPEGYRRQLAVYRRALIRAYPGRLVSAALLWTETRRLQRLDAAALDAAFARAAEAVDQREAAEQAPSD